MEQPSNLLFARKIDLIAPYPLATCSEEIRYFIPSLKAATQITADNQQFVICYGDSAQMKIWTLGTLQAIDPKTTHIQAQIGIDRQQSNLKYVLGISVFVWLSAILEGLLDDFNAHNLFIVAGLFFVGFWILLTFGMIYSQNRFRRDLIVALS